METTGYERSLGTAGGHGVPVNSTRAGYLPVPLAHVPAPAFGGIDLFLRAGPDRPSDGSAGIFTLYRGGQQQFTSQERQELLDNGIELAYIRMADHARFREQTEARVIELAADPKVAISTRAAIVYETGIELINELLSDPDMARFSDRIEGLSRSITTVVLNDPSAFSHLYTASHHDFYTATHLVNVATCMVPLAHALGHRNPGELNRVCQAGLLHDIGKLYVPESVLNKAGRLSDEDWWLIRRHPEMGRTHLKDYVGIDPLVVTVAAQHHERMDGGGYPAGLRGDELHPISRICAVVDAFDAMTAFRPFKERTLGVADALAILRSETPRKYDPAVVETWVRLVASATGLSEVGEAGGSEAASPNDDAANRREHQRYTFNCPVRVHMLESSEAGLKEGPAVQVVAHSISRSGLGMLSQSPLEVGQHVRVFLMARAWSHEYFDALTVRCRGYQDGWYEIGVRFTGRGLEGTGDGH